MSQENHRKLETVIAEIFGRPRVLKRQTQRHLTEHLENAESSLADFLLRAARELEDYEVEILFAPIFTPSFEEQVEVSEPLTRHRPSRQEIDRIVEALVATLKSCPIVLPEGETAPLTLHEALVERYVRLLRLDAAPAPEVATLIADALPPAQVPVALALLRRKGFTPQHQDWFARFLLFASDRHPVERESLETLADFVASQGSLRQEDLLENLESLLRATAEASSFAQKGRMYWSADVAEHHQFRGQGIVDRETVERNARDLRILKTLREDLGAFGDVLGAHPG